MATADTNTNINIYELALYKFVKEIANINHQIISKSIVSLLDLKKRYLALSKQIHEMIPADLTYIIGNSNIKCLDDLKLDLEKSMLFSLQLFKSYSWGEFSKLNSRSFLELYSMMTDQNGDLQRTYDDFKGTVAMMDFHGYTQFSKDIKYNKTPLQEFGDVLPQKIEQICNRCRCIVYEMEGDALIIIGPENPVFIFTAVLSIIELCRQRPFNASSNPKDLHGIEIKNPMIKPFEMNVAVSSGGRVFINKNGHIVGSLISEASRMLKIINTKKPNKSGIIMNERIYRKLVNFKKEDFLSHISIFDFKISDSMLIDVKGTRLNVREVYLEEKKYIDDTKEYCSKLAEEIKKKHPSKWNNILSYYLNLVLACLGDIKCTVVVGSETYTQDKIKRILDAKFYEWVSNPSLSTINDILKISLMLYNASEEIRDATAIYHEFIQESYNQIAKRLEEFYIKSLKKEGDSSPNIKKIIDNYETELNNLKEKFPVRRIIGTILTNLSFSDQMLEVPYIGKK